jgi:hypothetical protein
MKRIKMIKAPQEFYNWLNQRKIRIEQEVGRKVTYADAMRIIGMTPNIFIDNDILKGFFSKKRRQMKNVLL